MKIDTTNIQGYADMSAEEKIAYFENLEINDYAAELEKAKASVSKANSEAADYKRKLKEATSTSEKTVADVMTELNTIKEQYTALQREKTISENKANFIAQGYTEALALDSAEALIDGDTAKLFANMTAFMTEHNKAMQAENVGNMKRPGSGIGNPDVSVDYTKRINDALSAGDYSQAAYYIAEQQSGANSGNR